MQPNAFASRLDTAFQGGHNKEPTYKESVGNALGDGIDTEV